MKILLLFLLLFSFNSYSQLRENDYVFIRVFKYEKELEVWTRDSVQTEYTLYKKYPICRLSGDLGPKRKEGDLQVPEGFYYINDFNPNSKYKKSLGINYPNESDKMLSSHKNLGGNIYIHGDCVSVGCVAMGDKIIEELYTLCKKSSNEIPVHIFPIRFNEVNSLNILQSKIKDEETKQFEENIKYGFNYFEQYKYPPQILFNNEGGYMFF